MATDLAKRRLFPQAIEQLNIEVFFIYSPRGDYKPAFWMFHHYIYTKQTNKEQTIKLCHERVYLLGMIRTTTLATLD